MLEHETLIRLERSTVNCREKQIDPFSPSGRDVAARHFSASARSRSRRSFGQIPELFALLAELATYADKARCERQH
jgi:hypothetical protein